MANDSTTINNGSSAPVVSARFKRAFDTSGDQATILRGATDAQKIALTTPNVTVPIDASLIPNIKPLKIAADPTPSTTSAGLSGTASAIAESTKDALTTAIETDKLDKESELKKSKSLFSSAKDAYLQVAGSRQGEEEAAGIAKKAQAVSDARAEAQTASNNIIASQRAQENEVAALEKNPTGMSASALAGEAARINRAYGHEQADLSLISLVANAKLNNTNFDLSTAQTIVDNKIKNALEPLKFDMDSAEKFYNDNREDFTKSEDREFSNIAQQAKQKHDDEQKRLEDISDIQLEAAKNGAPASVIRDIGNAKTVQDAIAATSGYAQSVTDRLKTSGVGDTNQGLSPTTLAVIDNPNLINSLTPTVKGQVIAQLQLAGYNTTRLGVKPLDSTAVQAINQSNTALTSLSELKTIIENNKDKIGPIAGFATMNPYSAARRVQADIDRVKQQVGKALEGGVLRKEDEDKYKKILATITDTPETALYKLDQLTSSIQKSVDDYTALQTGAGKSSNVTGSLTKKGQNTAGTTSGGNKYTVTKD